MIDFIKSEDSRDVPLVFVNSVGGIHKIGPGTIQPPSISSALTEG
jgi:hypothetical protein